MKNPIGIYDKQVQALSIFDRMPVSDVKKCIDLSARTKVANGAFFYHQEDPAKYAYILLEGRVKLSQLTEDGQQIILRIAAPVQVFAIVAILPDRHYPVSAQAIEDCVAMAWDHEVLQGITKAHPAFMSNAMQLIAGYLQDFQILYRQMATERVEQRLARVLLRLHKLIGMETNQGLFLNMPLTRQELAEMCGSTLYTVSRLLSAWEDEAIIKAGRAKVFITDLDALTVLADDSLT